MLLIALAPQLMGVKLLGSGSKVMVSLLSRQVCVPGLGPQMPAIWPESLIADAPMGLRSVIVLPFHRNEEDPVLVSAWPTTSPDRLTDSPLLLFPPRSFMVPLLYKNAW